MWGSFPTETLWNPRVMWILEREPVRKNHRLHRENSKEKAKMTFLGWSVQELDSILDGSFIRIFHHSINTSINLQYCNKKASINSPGWKHRCLAQAQPFPNCGKKTSEGNYFHFFSQPPQSLLSLCIPAVLGEKKKILKKIKPTENLFLSGEVFSSTASLWRFCISMGSAGAAWAHGNAK